MGRIALALFAFALVSGCSDYGEQIDFGKGRVYYREGVPEDVAQGLGEFLSHQGLTPDQPYFGEEERRDVQLIREKNRYVVRFFVYEEQLSPGISTGFQKLMKPALEQEVFDGEKIGLQLCDLDENVLRDL